MTYQTSEEGMRKIRIDLLRQMPLQELEAIIVKDPTDILSLSVLKNSYDHAWGMVRHYRMKHLLPGNDPSIEAFGF